MRQWGNGMRQWRQFGLVLLSVAALTGWQRNASDCDLSPADIAAIRATTERWQNGARAGNWEAVAATFTPDAILRFPDASYEGRAAILKYFQAQQPWPANRTNYIDEIRGRGDMAFVAGHSTVTPDGGGAPVVVVRYLDIRLRQADGTWLFYRDMVSPVPQPKTE